jgi:hypothetical protein
MGNKIEFAPNTKVGNKLVNPTFDGRGSKIEHPDVLPIFLGSYWPGSGTLTVTTIMDALRALASGPYFDGLKQYGYVGPVQVRNEQVDSSAWIASLPAPGPNVNQGNSVTNTVWGYISSLLDHDQIDNVDDNHDLIVLIFLDPSNPLPQIFDNAGNVTVSVVGANSSYEDDNFLDDATRFEFAWIATSGGFASAMQSASHELVEAISDPFDSGWHQKFPAPSQTGGQITDVCNQDALSGGVAVTAYWSAEDTACIVPTPGVRGVFISHALTKHEPHDGPQKRGYVDFGKLCGDGYFDYFERTFANTMTVRANTQGYESPVFNWQINGQAIGILSSTVEVPATWEPEPRVTKLIPAPEKPATATLSTEWLGPPVDSMTISVGPNAGNVSFTVTVGVSESVDTGTGAGAGLRRTIKTAILDLDLEDQHIMWGNAYQDAKKNCDHLRHLANDPGEAIGAPRPGDPPDLLNIIRRALQDHSANRPEGLRRAAQLVQVVRPELARDLLTLADRPS